MEKNMSVKKIVILLLLIVIFLALIFFITRLLLGFRIVTHDARENREHAEYFYLQQQQRYQTSNSQPFSMDYTYNKKTNAGFLGSGGFTSVNCWERYIKDAWSGKEIASVSLCKDEKITKEKLDALNYFLVKYQEIF